jgi:DnaJ domain
MSEAEPDYFKVLGVSRSASQREIDRARRAIVRENHPDHNPDNKEAEERTKEANEAHAELSDPTARREHEAKLKQRDDGALAAKRRAEKEQKRKERVPNQGAAEAFGGATSQSPPPPRRPTGESPPPPPPPRKPFRPPSEPPPLILKYPSPSKPPSAQEDVASVLEILVKFIGACLLLAIPYVIMNVLLPAIGVIDDSGEDTPLEVLTLMVVGSACVVMFIAGFIAFLYTVPRLLLAILLAIVGPSRRAAYAKAN